MSIYTEARGSVILLLLFLQISCAPKTEIENKRTGPSKSEQSLVSIGLDIGANEHNLRSLEITSYSMTVECEGMAPLNVTSSPISLSSSAVNCLAKLNSFDVGKRGTYSPETPFSTWQPPEMAIYKNAKGQKLEVHLISQLSAVLTSTASVYYKIGSARRSGDILTSVESSQDIDTNHDNFVLGDAAPSFFVSSSYYKPGFLVIQAECDVPISGSTMSSATCADELIENLEVIVSEYPTANPDTTVLANLFASSGPSTLRNLEAALVPPGVSGSINGGYKVAMQIAATELDGSDLKESYLFAMNYAGNDSYSFAKILREGPISDSDDSSPETDIKVLVSDDATIEVANPTTNFGNASSLAIDSSSKQDVMIKFSLGAIGTGKVTSAKLFLRCAGSSPVGGIFHKTTTDWSESTVNWSSAPADGDQIASLGSVSNGNWYSVDISSLVTGDGVYSLRMSSTNTDGADYVSSEGLEKPYVIVTATGANGTGDSGDDGGGDGNGDIVVDPPTATKGIWISAEELQKLPMSGAAWNQVLNVANKSAGTPNLSDQDQNNNVYVLAKALVFARTGASEHRTEVRRQLEMAIDTELGGRTLALGRELAAYVIAADLINLPEYDAKFDNEIFRPWLRRARSETLDSKTLISTQEVRPNNWGTVAGSSRAAVAVYLNDQEDLARTAQVFKGWLGDRNAYASFIYKDLSWQCDPDKPVGINPKGCMKDGHNIDGVVPDDQRRGGSFTWPPPKENYVYSALQGALPEAIILSRAGYDVWNWSDKALLRVYEWLHYEIDFPAVGDDQWLSHIINHYYGTDFPVDLPARHGKTLGWTDWTHTKR